MARPVWMRQALDGLIRPATVMRLADPLALHLIAMTHNWDDRRAVPQVLSEHPQLDKGTALYLFWMADPEDPTLEERPHQDRFPHTVAADTARARLLSDDFRSRAISVDPRCDLQFNRLRLEKLRRAGVPQVLFEPTPGEPFDEAGYLRTVDGRDSTG